MENEALIGLEQSDIDEMARAQEQVKFAEVAHRFMLTAKRDEVRRLTEILFVWDGSNGVSVRSLCDPLHDSFTKVYGTTTGN